MAERASDDTELVVTVVVTAGALRAYAESVGVSLPESEDVTSLTEALADQVLAAERDVHGLVAQVTPAIGQVPRLS